MSGYLVGIAIECYDDNDQEIFRGAEDAELHPPPFCEGDKMMLQIHLEQLAKVHLLRVFRQHMKENAEYLPQAFKDAFHADKWQMHVRVFGYRKRAR